MHFEGKTAFITGGACGIGAAIAASYVEHGAKVVIGDIDAEAGTNTAKNLGKGTSFFPLNIADESAVNSTVDKIALDFGKIDILVNNAGITNDKLIIRMTREDWDKVMSVNLTGTFLVTKAVARYMIKQRFGRIVNIASVIGLIGNPGQANYASSKAGIIGLTKSCAKEFAARNITVNAVAPGFIETRMTEKLPEDMREVYLKLIPLGRFGKPGDVADLVLFLSSDQAGYITGQVITVDGGMVM